MGTRDPLPVVVICCDDEQAAPRYFEVLKREVKDRVTIHVRRAPRSGARGRDMLRAAMTERRTFQSRSEISDRTAIWMVIDAEHSAHDRHEAQAVCDQATAKGIQCAVSEPCFEVWTLLHLEATPGRLARCVDVVRAVEAAWAREFDQQFVKARAEYAKLTERRQDAIARSMRRSAADGCCTQVHRLVEQVLELARGSGLGSGS